MNANPWHYAVGGLVAIPIIGILAVLSDSGARGHIQRRVAALETARIESWQSYRDTECSLVTAEMREFREFSGKTTTARDKSVRVWRCARGAMYDEVASAVPDSWVTPDEWTKRAIASTPYKRSAMQLQPASVSTSEELKK